MFAECARLNGKMLKKKLFASRLSLSLSSFTMFSYPNDGSYNFSAHLMAL
jgi:hypothetical protein